MAMTVGELRALLEGLTDETEVRLAIQPNYPFEHEVHGAKLVQPNQAEIEEISDALAERDAGGDNLTAEETHQATARLKELQESSHEILYLVDGGQIGYTSRDMWDV